MRDQHASARRTFAVVIGVIALAAVILLFVQDAVPQHFPAHSHEIFGAFPLAVIAAAYIIFQLGRIAAMEMVKAILLAAAFLFWAANQFWPNAPRASLCNDIAIGLFVLDVFLAIAGWPIPGGKTAFPEAGIDDNRRCTCDCRCCGRGNGAGANELEEAGAQGA